MGYEELLKNVKEGLIKAAAEGKAKALASSYQKITQAFETVLDEAKEKFDEELRKICEVSADAHVEKTEKTSKKEMIENE